MKVHNKPLIGDFGLFVLIGMLGSAGCTLQLGSAPNLYVQSADDDYADVDPAQRSNRVELLYATDRLSLGKGKALAYGSGRSTSLAFGSCVVEIGKDVSWDDLSLASQAKRRNLSLPLTLSGMKELGRFPATG